jgi:hypothetical protein
VELIEHRLLAGQFVAISEIGFGLLLLRLDI